MRKWSKWKRLLTPSDFFRHLPAFGRLNTSDRRPAVMTRKLLVCGGTGLLGKALTLRLVRDGVQVVRLVRRRARPYPNANIVEVEWHPELPRSAVDLSLLEGCYAAVHLSGANLAIIAGRPPTSAYHHQPRRYFACSGPHLYRAYGSATGGRCRVGRRLLRRSRRRAAHRGVASRHRLSSRGLPGMGGRYLRAWPRGSCSCVSVWFSPHAAAPCPSYCAYFAWAWAAGWAMAASG